MNCRFLLHRFSDGLCGWMGGASGGNGRSGPGGARLTERNLKRLREKKLISV